MPNTTDTPTSAANAMTAAAIDRLAWAGTFTDALFDGISDEQLMARAGHAGNHPLWVLGHIAQAHDALVARVSGRDRLLTEAHDELFGGGTQPRDNRADYPSRDELVDALHRTRENTIAWVRSIDDATAFTTLPEELQRFAPTVILVPFTIVAHDLFHLGQVASVRASLGLEPVLG